MQFEKNKIISLPTWLDTIKSNEISCENDIDKMNIVIELAKKNIENHTGGPFSAAVFDCNSNEIISFGVNLVEPMQTSIAHAEMIALIFAQQNLKTHRLDTGVYELISLAQPCAMCYGALFWSGIKRLVYGATKEDVQFLTGFDEGPLPENWIIELNKRGVDVIGKIRQNEACHVLSSYIENNGNLY